MSVHVSLCSMCVWLLGMHDVYDHINENTEPIQSFVLKFLFHC